MASTLENALRLVKPGEMVVSLTDILNKLGDKITPAEKEQLLIAMLSPRREKVRPGDLITTDMLNQLLLDVADLQIRLLKLENSGSLPTTLRLIRIEGPTPIRVGSRVTVVGEMFSVPATRNGVSVDGRPVNTIDANASTAEKIVFDMIDPGQSDVGRDVTLLVVNSDSQKDTLVFRVEPKIKIPSGTLAVTYDVAPTGITLERGDYEFGFKLTGIVTLPVHVALTGDIGTVTGWSAKILTIAGVEITAPVELTPNAAGLIETPFLVRVTVPDAPNPAIAELLVGAIEATAGITAPVSPLNLQRGQSIPIPEHRVITSLLGTSSRVVLIGGAAIFTRSTRGRLDFQFDFNLGTIGATVSTSFTLGFTLDPATSTGWTAEDPSTIEIVVIGSSGRGDSSIAYTPGISAHNTRLLVSVTGTPTGQDNVNVIYAIPLQVL